MKKKLKISTDRVLSLSAIAIGLFTFLVYVYQSAIMTEQKHTSVWPYIEWIKSYNVEEGFYLSINNKGIGPAIVKDERFWLGDSLLSYTNTESFLQSFFSQEVTEYSYSTLAGRVLVPGESIRRFQLYNLEQAQMLDSILQVNRFRYEIRYCSVYDDCWISSGLSVKEAE